MELDGERSAERHVGCDEVIDSTGKRSFQENVVVHSMVLVTLLVVVVIDAVVLAILSDSPSMHF